MTALINFNRLKPNKLQQAGIGNRDDKGNDWMREKLSILMICHKSRLGAYARSHAMGVQLVQRGHQVTLLMISEKRLFGTETYDWDGVKAIDTPHLLPGRLKYGWDAWNLISRYMYLGKDQNKYDLIHCFETRPATIHPAMWYSKQHSIPILTDWNDWFGRDGLVAINRPEWYRLLSMAKVETYYEEKFRPIAAGTTVISSALGDRACRLGVPRERICWIPGGTFPEWFKLRNAKECRLRMGFDPDIPILGFSSSDSHFDMEIVMASLNIVARRFPKVRLIVTGKAKDSVHQLARDYGVEDRIDYVGYVPFNDLPWYLGCADAFLLPMAARAYNIGRWPNKMGEYLSLGRPTVSNPVGDIRKLFEEHLVGALAAWDPEDFAGKIIHLLEHPELSEQIGLNARQVAEKNYDWKILAEKLEDFYNFILSQSPKPMSLGIPE